MCPFQDTKHRILLVFGTGKPKLVLKTSTFSNLMMDSMNQLRAPFHHSADLCCFISWGCYRKWKAITIEVTIFSSALHHFRTLFPDLRLEKLGLRQWSEFPCKVAVQLNDTHPTLAIPELMRLIMDDEGLGCDEAWNVARRSMVLLSYTVTF